MNVHNREKELYLYGIEREREEEERERRKRGREMPLSPVAPPFFLKRRPRFHVMELWETAFHRTTGWKPRCGISRKREREREREGGER